MDNAPVVESPLAVRLARSLAVLAAFIALAVFVDGLLPTLVVSPLIFLLAVLGAGRILVDSAIVKPVRQALGGIPLLGPLLYAESEGAPLGGLLLTCMLCCGTWMGLALSLVGIRAFEGSGPLATALHGALGAGAAVVADGTVSALEAAVRRLDR